MTSSLLSPITGKREWPASMTLGRNCSGGSWMSTTSICARGTMMSRACSSETCSTPSIMASASASIRLRS